MRSPARSRVARVILAATAVTVSVATLAAAAPTVDLSLPWAANRNDGDQTRGVGRAVEGGKARNCLLYTSRCV